MLFSSCAAAAVVVIQALFAMRDDIFLIDIRYHRLPTPPPMLRQIATTLRHAAH